IYAVDGDRTVAKERIEVFGAGRSAIVDDFRRTESFVDSRRDRYKSRGRDKGFRAELEFFTACIVDRGAAAAAFDAAVTSTRATFALVESLALGAPIDLV